MKAFLDDAPTPERIEEYIERPVDDAAHRLTGLESRKLAMALVAEIRRLVDDSGHCERVRFCGDGEDPITYDKETNCFVLMAQVQKQEPTRGAQ